MVDAPSTHALFDPVYAMGLGETFHLKDDNYATYLEHLILGPTVDVMFHLVIPSIFGVFLSLSQDEEEDQDVSHPWQEKYATVLKSCAVTSHSIKTRCTCSK